MKAFWSTHLAAIVYFAVTQAALADSGTAFWNPDLPLVKSIEAGLVLPSTDTSKSGRLGTYARYYVGWTDGGHRILYGAFVRGSLAEDEPGLYIVPWSMWPTFKSGGGCDHIQLWFDVDAGQVRALQCAKTNIP